MALYSTLFEFSLTQNFLIGLGSFLIYLGMGEAVARYIWGELKSPLRISFSVILGFQLFNFIVEIVSFIGVSSTTPYRMIWFCTLPFAVFSIPLLRVIIVELRELLRASSNFGKTLVALCLVSISSLLLIATQLSTKSDSIKYHMLLPTQILEDFGLQFYNSPWQFTIISQMQYQISLTTVHALGAPHAGNVISFFLALTLAGSVASYVLTKSCSKEMTLLAFLICVSGMHASVWWVTSGSHALGDLAVFSAVVLLCLKGENRSDSFKLFALGLFSATAAGTKVSLLPLAMTITVVVVLDILRHSSRPADFFKNVLTLCSPWLFFYCPLIIWSLCISGYPLGPLITKLFHSNTFDISIAERAIGISHENNTDFIKLELIQFLKHTVALIPIALWIVIIIFLFSGRKQNKHAWWLGFAAMLFQAVLLYATSPILLRYFSGVPYACFAIAAGVLAFRFEQLSGVLKFTLLLLCVVPWSVLQLWYVSQFAPYALGIYSREQFREKYIAFYRDYKALDQLLEPDAILISPQYKSGIYSPRTIVRHGRDLPFKIARKKMKTIPPLYFFESKILVGDLEHSFPKQCLFDGLKYTQENAVVEISREPRGSNVEGVLNVWKVKCDRKWLMELP